MNHHAWSNLFNQRSHDWIATSLLSSFLLAGCATDGVDRSMSDPFAEYAAPAALQPLSAEPIHTPSPAYAREAVPVSQTVAQWPYSRPEGTDLSRSESRHDAALDVNDSGRNGQPIRLASADEPLPAPAVPRPLPPTELHNGVPAENVGPFILPQQPPPLLRTVTLDQAINNTLLNDPVLAAGFQAIRQAGADRVTATLRPNPELEVVQSLLPLTHPFVADEREGGPPQLDVIYRYPIDWYLFGKRAAAMQSATLGVRASQAEYADLVRQRVMEAAVAYVDVLEAQALSELARQDVENLQQVEEITALAVQAGARPQVELGRIRLDRLSSQQTLRESQRDLTAARAELRGLMGVADWEPQFEAAGGLPDPLRTPPPDIGESLGVAQANRPDIQALRWRISQASAEVDVQRREAYPEIVPEVGYTRQFQRRAIGQPDANAWGIGVAMELPFHDRNQGNRLRASSEWAQAGQELRAGLVELNAEITSLAAELETARLNAISTADEQLALAEQVRDSIRQAYEVGGRPLIDALDSQRNYRETVSNYITSRADYWRAVHRFNAALGTPLLR